MLNSLRHIKLNARCITFFFLLMALAACTRTGESGNVAAIPTASANDQPSAISDQQTIPNFQSPITQSLQELESPPERPLYVLNITLDYEGGVITAQQRIEFVNPTGVPIDEIKFSVPPARRTNALAFRDARIYRAKQPLSFELNGPVLTVKLPSTLQPGKAIAINFDFTVQVPLQEIVGAIGGDDTSRGPSNLTAGHWYIVLPPYTNGAWDLPEFVPVGDPFTSELADFEVNILAPEGVIVAAGGDEVREGRLWKYSLPKARVFAFAASPYYDVQTMSENGVTYVHYGFPRYKGVVDDVLFTAQRAIELFSRLYGPYPYKTFRVVQTDRAQGQEYSGMIAIGAVLYRGYAGKGSRHDVIATTAHETAHQWWFNVVGNDQVRTPWLDESFARFGELRFYQTYYPKDVDWWYTNYIEGRRKAVGKIDQSIYDYADSRLYVDAVYRNGLDFLRAVRDVVGKDVFDDILKDYYEAEAYKITIADAFFDAVARHSDEDLRGVVKAYFAGEVVLPCKVSANEPGCRLS
jgi:hypothetical protein